jgi:hypothetical protein
MINTTIEKSLEDSSLTTFTAASTDDENSDWNLDLDHILGTSDPEIEPFSADSPIKKQNIRRTKSLGNPNQPPAHFRSSAPARLSPTSSFRRNRKQTPRRSVSFDKVKVREFQQILGDTPARDDGPSLGLGWEYREKKELNVDKFEAKRTSMFSLGSKRKDHIRSMSPKQRIERACKLGFSLEEIQKNQKRNMKIQKQRRKTLEEELANQESGYTDAVELMMRARKSHGLTTGGCRRSSL